MVDFEIFVEIAQLALGESGDLVDVFFFGGLFGFLLGFGEFHGCGLNGSGNINNRLYEKQWTV